MSDDEYPEPPTAVTSLDPATLSERLDAGESLRLLDVRDRDEIERWRIDGPTVTSTHIPYAKFMQAKVRNSVAELADDIAGEGPITVVCGRGEASDFVAGLLTDRGIEARNLAGGMDAWARVYESHTIAEHPTVVQYRRPASGCLAYMVVSAGEAVVVDPLAAFTGRYVDDADRLDADIVAVVDTHVHADHVSGLRALAEATGARRVMPAGAVERGVSFDVERIADGESLTVGETTLTAVSLPGHTTGMMGVTVADVLLSGDSLFLDSVARPDLQDETDMEKLAGELYATVTKRIARFDDETLLAPGHCDPTAPPAEDGTYTDRLGIVRERLTVLDGEREAFVNRVTDELGPGPANAERIVAVNLGRETVTDETAFELELGPNNCAA